MQAAQLKAATALNIALKQQVEGLVSYASKRSRGVEKPQALMDAMAKELASVRAELLNQDKCTMDAKNSLDEATEEAE
eukprot:3295499-Pleurochrysis_carterae.AAC.1